MFFSLFIGSFLCFLCGVYFFCIWALWAVGFFSALMLLFVNIFLNIFLSSRSFLLFMSTLTLFLHTLIIYWRLINHIDDTLTVNQCQKWQFEDNWQWHALIIIENNIDNMENNIDNWEQCWQYWPSEGQWSAPDWQIHAASENQELHQHSISISISISIIISITYASASTSTASSTSASVLTSASVAILIAQTVENAQTQWGFLLRSIFKQFWIESLQNLRNFYRERDKN